MMIAASASTASSAAVTAFWCPKLRERPMHHDARVLLAERDEPRQRVVAGAVVDVHELDVVLGLQRGRGLLERSVERRDAVGLVVDREEERDQRTRGLDLILRVHPSPCNVPSCVTGAQLITRSASGLPRGEGAASAARADEHLTVEDREPAVGVRRPPSPGVGDLAQLLARRTAFADELAGEGGRGEPVGPQARPTTRGPRGRRSTRSTSSRRRRQPRPRAPRRGAAVRRAAHRRWRARRRRTARASGRGLRQPGCHEKWP